MAMINCPECGKEISDTVKNCIHCGYPIKKPKKELPIKKIGIVTVISLIAIIGIVILVLSNTLNDAEKADVEQVEKAITSIGDVQINSDSRIVAAERLFDELSNKCQRHVENRKELIEARESYDNLRAEETMELINKIGSVTLDNQDTVDKAKKSYDALSDEQRELVDNSDKLLSDIEQLTNLRIEDVNSKISAIGTVTLDSEKKITEAREAYDKLSDTDKSKVTGYEKLTVAEEDYEKLVVNNCIELIDSIGQVSLSSKKSIDNAQKVYDSLSKEAKDKVTNYSTLTSASSKYKQLEKEEEERKKTLNPGDSFQTSKWQVTYKKTNISAKILPNSTSGYYMYYYADDDQTFVDVVFQIKNVNTDILGIEDLVGSCEVEYDGTALTKNYELFVSSGSDIDKVYSWDGLDAFDSTTLHVAITMPRELQTNDKSVTVKLTIAGQDKIIKVR